MTTLLKLSYKWTNDPNDDFGQLFVNVVTPEFSSATDMWVQWQDIVEFGESLTAYPIPESEYPKCSFGFSNSDGTSYHPVIELSVRPIGNQGGLVFYAYRSDQDDKEKYASIKFQTDYAQIEKFRLQIASIMKCKTGEALLEGA